MKKILALVAFLIVNCQLSIAQYGISGGSIIYVNVTITDSNATASKYTADTVVATGAVSTPVVLTDTTISTGGATFDDNVAITGTLTVSNTFTAGDDATFDSTITAIEVIADTIHSGTLTGIAKFTSGVLWATDTIAFSRLIGLQDTINTHTDSLEALRAALNQHQDSLNTHTDSLEALRAAINVHATGTATIGTGDSVQVTIAGLTNATGMAVLTYNEANTVTPTKFLRYKIWSDTKLSIFGDDGLNVTYWITKN